MGPRVRAAAGAAVVALALILAYSWLQAPTAAPVRVGDPAPDFAAPALDGSDHPGLAAVKGHAVLLVFFNTVWPGTQEDLAEIERVHRRYLPRGLRVVGIALDQGEMDADFQRKGGLTFPVLHDPGARRLASTWGRPTSREAYLIAADGRVASVMRGVVQWRSPHLRQEIEDLLPPERRVVS